MSVSSPIYLDNNATTPLDPRVLESMIPFLTRAFGNPSSTHTFGREASKAVQRAREQVAHAIQCEPDEIIFTSGATESNNLALRGVVDTFHSTPTHIATTNIEHKAVERVVDDLREAGHKVSILEADQHGQIFCFDVEKLLEQGLNLLSVMSANNEVGTLNPIEEIGERLRDTDVIFHCDAAQALGKIPFNVKNSYVDLAAFSAHKVYGPKGVGALFVRRGTPLRPQLTGGAQEFGLRAGTLNVPGIVGFGMACELAMQELDHEFHRLESLRNQTLHRLQSLTPNLRLNGHPSERLPGQMSLTLPHIDPDLLTLHLGSIALSRTSACGEGGPSKVLSALGLSPALALRTLRLEFGRFNSSLDADILVQKWAAFSPGTDRDIVTL
jgi:cysteine desulfurase